MGVKGKNEKSKEEGRKQKKAEMRGNKW